MSSAQIIDMLERALEKAKAGQIAGLNLFYIGTDGGQVMEHWDNSMPDPRAIQASVDEALKAPDQRNQ